MGSSLHIGSLFIRVPYYFWDLNRDPNLENYPHGTTIRAIQEPQGVELVIARLPYCTSLRRFPNQKVPHVYFRDMHFEQRP